MPGSGVIRSIPFGLPALGDLTVAARGVLIAEIQGEFYRAIKASSYRPLGRPPLPGSARASTKMPPASPWTGTIAG